MGTHSSLKSGTLDLDLSSTAISNLVTGQEENVQIMPDISDSEVGYYGYEMPYWMGTYRCSMYDIPSVLQNSVKFW